MSKRFSRLFGFKKAVRRLIGDITSGWDLFIPSNDTAPLNTANEIIGTSGGGSFIAFADLTGVTITSTVGTGVLTIVGNDMDYTTSGNIRKITVDDNGTTRYFLLTEGVNGIIKTSDGILMGVLNGVTFINGVDTANSEGTQTALISFNNHGYFNNAPYVMLTPEVVNVTGDFMEVDMMTSVGTTLLGGQGTGNQIIISDGAYRIYYTRNGVLVNTYIYLANNLGVNVKLRIERLASGNLEFSLNGILQLTTIGGNDTFTTERLGSYYTAYYTGIIFNYNYNGINRNTFNDWGAGATFVGVLPKYVAPENPLDLGNDYFGETIQRLKLTDGYSHSGQVEYFDTNTIFNTVNAETFNQWVKVETSLPNQLIGGNDVCTITTDASGFIAVTYNGVTLTSTQLANKGQWYYVSFTSDAIGGGIIYIGDEFNASVLNISGAVGVAVAATTPMIYGNDNTTGGSGNLYITQMSHFPLAETLTEIEFDRGATVGKL
jgi:hypothetical protein